MTEPKMLPLPPSTFAPPYDSDQKPSSLSNEKERKRVGAEEGWEDGEDLGPDDDDCGESGDEAGDSEWTDSSDAGGSWLEGRFQR